MRLICLGLSEFRQEVYLQDYLVHPSFVRLLGIICRPFCLIMELCELGNLHFYFKNEKNKFPLKFKFKVAEDIAKGLEFLQSQTPQIAHIDLKSPNILLFSDDPSQLVCAKIADFGTSEFVKEPILVRKVNNPIWQAPEVLNGEPYDHRVDTYAFGIICYEILVRLEFYSHITFTSDIWSRITSGQRPSIPQDICDPIYLTIIDSCWHQLPEKRPLMNWVLTELPKCLLSIDLYQKKYEKYETQLLNKMEGGSNSGADRQAGSLTSFPDEGRPLAARFQDGSPRDTINH